jgi:hypothetical protein
LAKEDITLASKEKIEEQSLVLEKKIETTSKKRSGFSKKTTIHTQTHHKIIANMMGSVQGNVIHKLGENTATASIEGTQISAGKDIIFAGGTYDVSGWWRRIQQPQPPLKKG